MGNLEDLEREKRSDADSGRVRKTQEELGRLRKRGVDWEAVKNQIKMGCNSSLYNQTLVTALKLFFTVDYMQV